MPAFRLFIVEEYNLNGITVSVRGPKDPFPTGFKVGRQKPLIAEIGEALVEAAWDYPKDKFVFEQLWAEFKNELYEKRYRS